MAAPAIVHAHAIMPVSSKNLPSLSYVIATGPEAGTIVKLTSASPLKTIPCDNRMVNGLDWPELFKSVRGYEPKYDDELHIMGFEDHAWQNNETVDQFVSMKIVEATKVGFGIRVDPETAMRRIKWLGLKA